MCSSQSFWTRAVGLLMEQCVRSSEREPRIYPCSYTSGRNGRCRCDNNFKPRPVPLPNPNIIYDRDGSHCRSCENMNTTRPTLMNARVADWNTRRVTNSLPGQILRFSPQDAQTPQFSNVDIADGWPKVRNEVELGVRRQRNGSSQVSRATRCSCPEDSPRRATLS